MWCVTYCWADVFEHVIYEAEQQTGLANACAHAASRVDVEWRPPGPQGLAGARTTVANKEELQQMVKLGRVVHAARPVRAGVASKRLVASTHVEVEGGERSVDVTVSLRAGTTLRRSLRPVRRPVRVP